jgi:hypothetical protein
LALLAVDGFDDVGGDVFDLTRRQDFGEGGHPAAAFGDLFDGAVERFRDRRRFQPGAAVAARPVGPSATLSVSISSSGE